RRVEVGNVVGIGVEDIKDVEANLRLLVDSISRLGTEYRRGIRPGSVVFDERCRSKVTTEDARRPGSKILDRDATGRHSLQSVRNEIADRVAVAKARVGPGEVKVDQKPRGRRVVVVEFDAISRRRAAGFGRARV